MGYSKIIAGSAFLAYLAALIISANQATAAAGGLNCTISSGTTCSTNFTKLLGLENDTGGQDNAHAENATFGTYGNSMCCEPTESGVSLSISCSGTIFLRLSNVTNAHVQQEQVNTYPEDACMESSLRTPTCQYETGSCSSGFECLGSMENSEGSNTTNAHIATCPHYDTKICCKLNNTAPTAPTLVEPINASSITDRTPFYNWTQSTDADGDPITYRVQVARDSGFSTIVIDNETSATNFTPGSEMDFDTYFWRVYANDSKDWSVSGTENFSIVKSVVLTMTTNTVDFGELPLETSNGTDDDNPPPFVLRNDGNTEANVSINSSQLFQQASLGTDNYQYKADNSTAEPGAFDDSTSTLTYTNITASQVNFLNMFNHTNSTDEAEIDIQVRAPGDEPPGSKSATVVVVGEASS